jgi:polysaccharide export outer membrane protein
LSVKHRIAFVSLAAAAAVLGGCTMPRPVASFSEVERSGKAGDIQLIPVTGATIPPAPVSSTAPAFPADFVSTPEPDYDRLGPGDRLSVRIWESGSSNVFASTGSTGSDLGELTIDDSGRVYLPYVGAIQAEGLTVPQLRSSITQRLRTVVLNPQVDVRLVEHRSALVSVQGAAGKTGSFPIEQGRTRLSQLLAEAAPDQKNPAMLDVVVRRNGRSATARLSEVYSNPRYDIALQPGDSVILRTVDETVTVLGAAGVQGTVPMTKRNFTLLDALGASRGLNPEAANPRAVFLMRLPENPNAAPVVYHFDMRRPEEVSYAARTVLQDKDAVLISSAPFAQLRLVLASVAQSLVALRSAAAVVP